PAFVQFTGVTNLRGAANNRDTFHTTAAGSIAGVIDGGPGGFDSLVIDSAPPGPARFTAFGPHSGTIALGAQTINYDGLEPITLGGTASDVTVTGSAGDDNLVVETLGGGMMQVRSTTGTIESVQFAAPTNSLTVDGGDGF